MSARTDAKWAEKKWAVIEGPYRYWWHRKFEDGDGLTVFGMLNPSKADAKRNDPTSRRCVDFAQTWNSNAVILVNLYAAMSTDPDALQEMDNPIGPRNLQFVDLACDMLRKEGGQFVVAWGTHNIARLQAPRFLTRIRDNGVIPMHLGLTEKGLPRHPLFAPANSELEVYGW